MSKLNAFVRVLFSLVFVFILVGCNSVPGKPVVPIKDAEPKVKPVKKTMVAKVAKKPNVSYGRFKIEDSDGKLRIVGGKFTPPDNPPFFSKYDHTIYVNYSTKELLYYSHGEPVIGYAVVTPAPSYLPKDVVRGVVTKIDRAPTWGPTPNIRRKLPNLPAGMIPYGHPQNAMGAVKFEIAWNVPNWQYIRIHGTEGYAENGRFWEIETFGCVRVQNEVIKYLADLLAPARVKKEKIEVVVFRLT